MSTGYDGISGHVFKNVSMEISIPLSYLINNSLINGTFPSALKEAKIIPIFKAGDKSQCSNYRPISILPFFSKIFEKIIYKRLKSYLNTINIPSKNQFGFQEKCSTYMALANAYEHLTDAADNKLYSIGVFIDLCKAFDTVDHDILLSKLRAYGVRGKPLDLLTSYLSNHLQRVSDNNVLSDPLQISCGVPQGSILGPLLFLVYVDDMQYCSTLLKLFLFADDYRS